MAEKDSQYLVGLKEGNRSVFEQIFREYYPLLCNHLRPYTHNKDIAEEVVQDFFCKLWDKHSELQINTSLGNYLRKSVFHHCLNHNRKLGNNHKLLHYSDSFDDTLAAPDSQPANELSKQLSKALLELPEKRRQIFEMSRFEGMKYHEIADKLNINIKTVETQMSRSLEFMRKYLKDFIAVIALIMSGILTLL